jgi:hypothetical protein
MRFILLFLFFTSVNAHMPVFPSSTSSSAPHHLSDVIGKSWGVYGDTASITWLTMDGIKSEEMTVSLQRNRDIGFYDVAIWGPGMNQVNCSTKFFGWAHGVTDSYFTRDLSELPAAVLQAIGTSEAIVLHGDAKQDPEYEAFGVNAYWPIGGCKDKFPATATYSMAVVHPENKTQKFSLGVGMAESFTVPELLTMSFPMLETFLWGGRSMVSLVMIYAMTWLLTFVMILYWFSSRYTQLQPRLLSTIASYALWLGLSGLVASSAVWLSQLLWSLQYVSFVASMWVAIAVHIVMPLIYVELVVGFYDPRFFTQGTRIWAGILVIVGAVLMLLLAWQSYIVFPSLVVVGAIMHMF